MSKSRWRETLPETSKVSACFDCGKPATMRTELPQRDEDTFGFLAFDKACDEHVSMLKQPVVPVMDVSVPKK
jgi:hypothetical protein